MPLLKVAKVRAIADPVAEPPWGSVRGMKSMLRKVEACLKHQEFMADPVGASGTVTQHAQRIAYLVVHGWKGPIQIDVGVPSISKLPTWPVTDGNHRLYAAIWRGDEMIEADISGDIDYAATLFDIPVGEIEIPT